MSKQNVTFLVILVSTILISAAIAQGPRGGKSAPLYDTKTELTLKGTVEAVLQQPFMGRHVGTHLTLKTRSETIDVHLGPSAYVQEKGFSFTKGDEIEVVGSRVKSNGADVIIARQITKDGKTLTLRNAQGLPEWSGGQRK